MRSDRRIKRLRAVSAAAADANECVDLWRGLRDMNVSDAFTLHGGTECAPCPRSLLLMGRRRCSDTPSLCACQLEQDGADEHHTQLGRRCPLLAQRAAATAQGDDLQFHAAGRRPRVPQRLSRRGGGVLSSSRALRMFNHRLFSLRLGFGASASSQRRCDSSLPLQTYLKPTLLRETVSVGGKEFTIIEVVPHFAS